MSEQQAVKLPTDSVFNAICEFSENLIHDVGQETRAALTIGMEPEPVKTFQACVMQRFMQLGFKASGNLDEIRKFFENMKMAAEMSINSIEREAEH